LQASLVIINGSGSRAGGGAPLTLRDTDALALQNLGDTRSGQKGPATESGTERPAGARAARPATAPDETGLEPPGADRVRESAGQGGVYYVRALVGSAFDHLRDDNQGYLGKGIESVPLSARESWGTPAQEEALRGIFHLRSIVPIDGVYLRETKTGVSEGKVDAAAARKVYSIAVKGELVKGSPTEHTVTVQVARKFPKSKAGETLQDIEIPLVVQNGAMAILCIPDSLLSERDRNVRGQPNALFVAVSPRFSDLAPSAPLVRPSSDEAGYDPAVVVERVEPRYPEDAREFGVHGEVVLEATVLRDGSVDRVRIVSIPAQTGAELLIEPASIALRRWRFLPARFRGEDIDSLVTVTMELRPDRP
jgi:protein TonB